MQAAWVIPRYPAPSTVSRTARPSLTFPACPGPPRGGCLEMVTREQIYHIANDPTWTDIKLWLWAGQTSTAVSMPAGTGTTLARADQYHAAVVVRRPPVAGGDQRDGDSGGVGSRLALDRGHRQVEVLGSLAAELVAVLDHIEAVLGEQFREPLVRVRVLHRVALAVHPEQPGKLAGPGDGVGGHDKLPAGSQHPRHLGQRSRAVVEMLDRADRHYPVETAVPERQPERVSLHERWSVGQLPAEDHLRPGQIDRDRVGTALAGLPRPVPVATGHIEHPLAGQIVTKPAQERPGLPVAAKVHLMTNESDQIGQRHPVILGGR